MGLCGAVSNAMPLWVTISHRLRLTCVKRFDGDWRLAGVKARGVFSKPGFHQHVFLDDMLNQPVTQESGEFGDILLCPVRVHAFMELFQLFHQGSV